MWSRRPGSSHNSGKSAHGGKHTRVEELLKPPRDPPLKPKVAALQLSRLATRWRSTSTRCCRLAKEIWSIICLWSTNPEETGEGQESCGVLQTIDSQRDAKMAASQLRADGKITAMHHSRSQFSNVKFNLLGLPLPDRWKRSPFESETAGL